jgi:small nuclear ribonucleoprotein (snRNP)-like protein
MKISELKEFVDKTVTLRMTDGEVLRVRVIFRSEEYNDIIVDVLETTRPERYDPSSAYSFNAADILS